MVECGKMKRVTSTLAKGFVCELCVNTIEGIAEPGEEISFFDQVDFVKSFCYYIVLSEEWSPKFVVLLLCAFV